MKVKRFIAVLICILMMASLIPASVLADDAAGETGPGSGTEGEPGSGSGDEDEPGAPAEGEGIHLGTVLTDGGTLSTGIYYLQNDVTLTKMIYIPKSGTVTIDLNGHVLDRNLTSAEDDGCVIKNDGNLTIVDNQPEAKHDPAVTFTSGFDGSTLTVQGGVIRGGYNKGDGGGIVNNYLLTFRAGTIAGNAANRGGGIYCSAGSITVIALGNIKANTATDTGDGPERYHIHQISHLVILTGLLVDSSCE